MKRIVFALLCIGIGLVSCKSGQSVASAKEKSLVTKAIEQQKFRIESSWAHPQTTNALQQVMNAGLIQPGSDAGAISLLGNTNFLTLKGDSISSYLPYFGERQMQVAYSGTDNTIQFKGLLEDYSITKDKKSRYTISFRATSNTERFDVMITLFPNATTRIYLNSASRFPISYLGELIAED